LPPKDWYLSNKLQNHNILKTFSILHSLTACEFKAMKRFPFSSDKPGYACYQLHAGFLTYSSSLKMDGHVPLKHQLTLTNYVELYSKIQNSSLLKSVQDMYGKGSLTSDINFALTQQLTQELLCQMLFLVDFLRSRGSGAGSTQPCEDN
jgi:hypothetical protein